MSLKSWLLVLALGVAYFALAKGGLTLASINPSATPIWPPTGLALAAVILWGYRVAPAVFLGALLANVSTAGTVLTSTAIAFGNTLECLVGGYLVARWSGGIATFTTPGRVVRFAAIALAIATPISATVGVGSLSLAGFTPAAAIPSLWMTWWLGDLAGAVVVTPIVVLWVSERTVALSSECLRKTALVSLIAVATGLAAFTSIMGRGWNTDPLAFLVIVPLMWAALRHGPRDTATVALILSGLAVGGTLLGAGPFARATLNDSLLLLVMFTISISVPSIALSADVAVRRRVEASLEQQMGLLKTITDNAASALVLIDREGRTTFINPAGERLTGYGLSEIRGKRLHDAIHHSHPDGRPFPVETCPIRWIRSPEPIRHHEDVFVRRDGSFFAASCNVAPLRRDGHIDGAVVEISDISDRKRAETERQRALAHLQALTEALEERVRERTSDLEAEYEARKKAEETLRQALKMEAIGQLTGGVAHDFNNLMTIIQGGLDMIGRQVATLDPSPAVSRIARGKDMSLEGVRRAAKLTNRLLAFARQQPLDPRPIDANKLVSGVCELLRRSLGETISMETVLAGGLWRTYVDANQLENALVNLAVNARDAMPDGGKLTIETANCYLDQTYVGGLAEPVAPGQYVMIAVADTGTGMDRSALERAFEPFFTTKGVGKGTGLGLSQVYGFVRQSAGHVRIYSELGEGTTVKVYLPRHVGNEAESDELERRSVASKVPTAETVLVVEDDDALRSYAIEALDELGYGVLAAADAAAALEILGRDHRVDLLFTDVVMPGGMNGRQLADDAVKRRPGLKVLFTTGYTRNAIVHQGRLDPGVEMIGKPYSFEELGAKVRSVLDRE